jgi:hypothetical protein
MWLQQTWFFIVLSSFFSIVIETSIHCPHSSLSSSPSPMSSSCLLCCYYHHQHLSLSWSPSSLSSLLVSHCFFVISYHCLCHPCHISPHHTHVISHCPWDHLDIFPWLAKQNITSTKRHHIYLLFSLWHLDSRCLANSCLVLGHPRDFLFRTSTWQFHIFYSILKDFFFILWSLFDLIWSNGVNIIYLQMTS